MSTVISVVLLLCGVIVLLYKYSTRNYNYWKCRGVAGPKPIPFFGNLLPLARRMEYRSHLFARFCQQFPHEKIVGIYRFTTPLLLIKDPEIIKHIFVKDFDVFQSRGIEFSKRGFGTNLIHSDGDTWSILRKKMSPAFTSARLKDMYYLIENRASEFTKYVDSIMEEDKPIEINNLIVKLTAEVIGTCFFGVNIDAFNKNFNEYIEIGNKISKQSFRVLLDLIIPGVLKTLDMDLFSKEIQDFFNNLVKAALREREGQPKVRRDFMDLLIEMKERGQIKGNKVRSKDEIDMEITESVLAAQVFIFYFAGFDTTAATISFALYELAFNPDIQSKVVEEIQRVLEVHNNKVTYEAIKDMKYLDMVVAETLRKHPVTDIARKSVHEYKIPGTEVTLPKGSFVLIPTLGLHHDPDHYPEPERFDPERFCPENVASRNPFAYLPFGRGPRECIGVRLAQLSVKINVIYFLMKFQVTPSTLMSKNLEYTPQRFTVEVKGGLWLNVKHRQYINNYLILK